MRTDCPARRQAGAGLLLIVACCEKPDESRPVRFRPARDSIALRPLAARQPRACWWCGQGDGLDGPHRSRPAGPAARPATCWCSTTPRSSRRSSGVRLRGDAVARCRRHLHMRVAPDRWLAFARPAKRVQAGDRIAIRPYRQSPASWARSTPRWRRRATAGEVLLRLRPRRRRARRGAARGRAYAAAALHRLQASGRRPRPQRLPDDLRRRGRRCRRADRRLAFHPGTDAPRSTKGIERHFVTLHVGAGTFPAGEGRYRRPQDACRKGDVSADGERAECKVKARGGRIVAVGTTSLRLLESAPTTTGLEEWSGDRHLHHAGIPLQICRCADDQFPPAALDAVHAGLGVFGLEDAGAYAHAIAGVSVLFHGGYLLFYRDFLRRRALSCRTSPPRGGRSA
jgi:S-adenosylmethionine:tRNA ribosyltransferase-isomerase